LAAFFRGRWVDRILMMSATAGMSVSFLVYIIVLQYLLTFQVKLFPIYGFPDSFVMGMSFLILPVLIQVIVSMGYDSRFYRAVMVEESTKDYITTAYAKGLSTPRVIFVHMLKNAMIPIVTRVFISLPFLFMGSFLLEVFFGVPGLGSALINALTGKTDPPLIIGATAILCSLYIVFLILTDVVYGLVDPRVRLE
jgi:peptide/nickel transport system permease protein